MNGIKLPMRLMGNLKARPEVSPQRTPLTEAQAMFFKRLQEVGGDETEVRACYVKLQISFLVGGDLAAKERHTRGRKYSDEGCLSDEDIVSKKCRDFSDVFF